MAAKVLLLFNYRQISCKIQPPTGRNSCRSSCSGRRACGGESRWASSSSASFALKLRGSREAHPGGPSGPGGLSSAGPVLGEAQQRCKPWHALGKEPVALLLTTGTTHIFSFKVIFFK